ncbi:MAG TPA: YihY/virulence factor BrkB family protein [Geobacteraceae bacterium]|nr:YihY/virulence factor BrkB family protein [Geobacteraceae bacterium]
MAAAENISITEILDNWLRRLSPDECRGVRRYGATCLQILLLAIRNFWNDQCMLRASALAFTTILSLVPFLALTFAVLKGFGVQKLVEPLVMEQLSGGSQEVATRIIDYINNTNMGSLGVFGLLALVVTVITLLGNVEEALNAVWKVEETRSLQRKFSDYLSVVVVGPILMFTAVSMTSFLQSQSLVKWLVDNSYVGDFLLYLLQMIPYMITWVALVFLYIFIPNTAVRIRPAILGGVLAGTCWQFVQWGYIHFQVGVAKYNAIYGTLAVLPIFMVWIYTSWLIVLFGAEVVHALQNIKIFRRELRAPAINFRLRELLALAVLQDVVTAFVTGTDKWTAKRLEDELELPERVLAELLDELVAGGLLLTTTGDPPAYQPAREPDQIMLSEVLNILRDFGGSWQPQRLTGSEEKLQKIIAGVDAAAAGALAGMTLRDLAEV